jgi:DNA-binding NarL/FixJ family response regulator
MPMIRVVIVDDYPFMRFGLRELLNAEADIEVVAECADGQEAVDVVGHLNPDVVVTDLKMPRLDGAETTRRLLAGDPRIAVLVVTSAPHGELAARARAAGAHAVLAKDLDPPLLVAAVRAADAGRPAPHP